MLPFLSLHYDAVVCLLFYYFSSLTTLLLKIMSDAVSSLWSRLMESELNRVMQNTTLRNRLCTKTFLPGSANPELLAANPTSCEASANFYLRVVSYVANEASDQLRRIGSFLDDLSSGIVDVKNSEKARHFREMGNKSFK